MYSWRPYNSEARFPSNSDAYVGAGLLSAGSSARPWRSSCFSYSFTLFGLCAQAASVGVLPFFPRWRRMTHQAQRPAAKAATTTPPTVPPAIAPILEPDPPLVPPVVVGFVPAPADEGSPVPDPDGGLPLEEATLVI